MDRASRLNLPADLRLSLGVGRLAGQLWESGRKPGWTMADATYHAARIVQLARRLFRAGERYCNTGTEQDDRRYDRMLADLRQYVAEELAGGWRVELPGLWPQLVTPSEVTVYIPDA